MTGLAGDSNPILAQAAPGLAAISTIIVTYNSQRDVTRCLQAWSIVAAGHHEVIVADNASADDTLDLVRSIYASAPILANRHNLGFGGGVNSAYPHCSADVIAVLNPDVAALPGWPERILQTLRRSSDIGIVGCKLLYPDSNTIQHAGGVIHYPLALTDHYGYGEEDRGQHDEPREVDYVTGAAFAIKRSVLEEVGGFDEGFYPAYYEETDLCYRVRQAGYKVLYVPDAVAIHHESATTGKDTFQYYHFFHRNRLRFVLKHYTDSQLWQDFLPAELSRLRSISPSDELRALREAYADNLAVLEGRADFFARPERVTPLPSGPGRVELVRTLSTVAEQALVPPSIILVSAKPVATPARTEPANPVEAFTFGAAAQVTERPFVSHAPILGPWIVRFRNAWNWMATTWYVRPLLEQQNAFNAAVVDALGDLHRLARENQVAMRELRVVTQQLAEHQRATDQQARAADRTGTRLNRDVENLERRLQCVEARVGQQPGLGTAQPIGQPTIKR